MFDTVNIFLMVYTARGWLNDNEFRLEMQMFIADKHTQLSFIYFCYFLLAKHSVAIPLSIHKQLLLLTL